MTNHKLSHRKAVIEDLHVIIELYTQDEFSQPVKKPDQGLSERYQDVFRKIQADPNHYLMIVENYEEIVGTCHLALMPSLTLSGSTRMQIEGVYVRGRYRGQKVGEWMINAAIDYAKMHGALIVQLATHKQRVRAKKFYERLGFQATHEGMKLFINQP